MRIPNQLCFLMLTALLWVQTSVSGQTPSPGPSPDGIGPEPATSASAPSEAPSDKPMETGQETPLQPTPVASTAFKIPPLPVLKSPSETDERPFLIVRLADLRKEHGRVLAGLWRLRADFAKRAREVERQTRDPHERSMRMGALLSEIRLREAGPVAQVEVLESQLVYLKQLLDARPRLQPPLAPGAASEDPVKYFARLKAELERHNDDD